TRIGRALTSYGLDGAEPFIPDAYLQRPVEDRLELLRGLFDTDRRAVVRPGQIVEYEAASARLADGVAWLTRSLGGIATRDGNRLSLWFPKDVVPVSTQKHLARWSVESDRFTGRFIESVEPMGTKECQCILIDSADHLYVTSDFVVTHNTACCLNIA